ncbi:MAG: TIGR03790 family protein [Bryobacteraceae bacterium]
MRLLLRIAACCWCLAAAAWADPHPQADRVLILVNDAMKPETGTGAAGAGVFVGEYYAGKRGIPKGNILHLTTTTLETIPYADYLTQVEKPVKAFLEANGGAMKRQVLYIVPTYGIPLKAYVTGDQLPALDSLLAGMYASPTLSIRIANPYTAPLASRPPKFAAWSDQRDAAGLWKMFLVSRLDGPGAMIATGLVDKAISAEASLTLTSGKGYFDYQGTRSPSEWQYAIDEEIRNAAALSRSTGFPTVLNTQRESLCGLMFHPAAVYYYDAAAKNVYVNAAGTDATTSFSIPALEEGDVVVRLKNENLNNYGNLVYLTLATADPKTHIKLTYPFVPFNHYDVNDAVTLEKFVNGSSVAKASLAVKNTMTDALNGLTELKISFRGDLLAVSRNGTVLLQAADASGTPIGIKNVSLGARCWNYRLSGFSVTDKAGGSVWNDTFSADTTKNYTWDMPPAAGLNALWVWGWYGGANDSYRFVNGAVGAQLTSFTAITIRTPVTADPTLASVDTLRWGGNWVPRMLEEGVTATWGAVTEPFANYYAPGGNVFDHFWSGYNFAESFYIAQNTLNWVMTAVGDPLYSPKVFQRGALPARILKAVANGASGQTGSVAPGEIVVLFGEGLGPSPLVGGILTTGIEGTRVLFDEISAPLIYASAAQTAAIVPYEIAQRSSTDVVLEKDGVRSNPLVMDVAPAVPGIFAVTNEDGALNSNALPADKGSIIVLYATGEGQTNPPGVTGSIASSVYPKPVLPVSVQLGGANAEILYAGAAPGQVAGLMQVNVRIPESMPSGRASIILTVGNAASRPGPQLAIR